MSYVVKALFFAGGGNLCLKFEKEMGSQKNVWGDLKGPCHRYVTEGAYYAPCQKRLCKIKNGC